jgi:AsmA protein
LKKFWKISLITLLVLLLLIAAAIFYVFATFKPNDLKQRLTDFFQQKYQRQLLIPGELQLSLWPLLHIESGKISLLEKNGSDVLASMESAKISLVWRPLIEGRLEVDGVTLDAPSVHIKRFADGTTNIDDFLTGGGGGPGQFDIKGLKINRASWVFDDQATQWNMTNANLQVGRLSNGVPTDFKFDGDLRLNQDQLNAHIDLNSPLLFDLAKQNFSLGKLALAIKGTSKAANTTTLNDIALNATGAMTFDAAKKLTHLGEWTLQSQLINGDEKWQATVAFSEAEQQGKNWRAKNISSQAEQQTAAYHLNTTLNMPELNSIDARMSGKDVKLTTQWTAKPDAKKGSAKKNQNTINALLTLGALDDVNDASGQTSYDLHTLHLEAKGVVDAAPVKLHADGDIQIINNNQIVTKGPLRVQFNYQPVGLALEGSLKTEAKIMLEREQYELSPLLFDLTITPTDFKRPMTLIGNGAMNTDLKRKIISAKLQAKFNQAKLEGKIGVAGFTPPAYTFDVLLSEFNTAWLENKTGAAKTAGDLPDFGWLKKLNANGVLRIGELISADKRATNVRTDVKSDK